MSAFGLEEGMTQQQTQDRLLLLCRGLNYFLGGLIIIITV